MFVFGYSWWPLESRSFDPRDRLKSIRTQPPGWEVGIPIYSLSRYVPPSRVWFSATCLRVYNYAQLFYTGFTFCIYTLSYAGQHCSKALSSERNAYVLLVVDSKFDSWIIFSISRMAGNFSQISWKVVTLKYSFLDFQLLKTIYAR